MRRYIALVLIAAMSACSTVQTVPPAPAEVCAEPGLWAVLARPSAAATSSPPSPLSTGGAAAAGAKAGAVGSVLTGAALAGGMLSSGHSEGDFAGLEILVAGVFLAAGIALAPVAAVVGAGVGAGTAHPDEEIAAAQRNMIGALEVAKPGDAIRAGVVALAEERAGRRMYDCGGLRSLEACRQQSPEPIAVVLSMTVSAPYFEVEGSINPDLRLLLSDNAEVVRTSDATAVYRRAWVYRGRQHDYFDLAANDAALFREQLETATNALAAKVVDDILIGGREEVHPSAEQPEGTVWTVLPPNSANRDADCP